MFSIKSLNKSLIAMSAAFMLLIGVSATYAEEVLPEPIIVVEPSTGRLIEAPKHFSHMTEEEKAAYTEEDLKLLEEYEAKMKEAGMSEETKY